jgi:hypothetical protein
MASLAPVLIDCPKDTWTLVAANVTTGFLRIKKTTPMYYHTWRATGETAPSNFDDAVALEKPCHTFGLSFVDPADIYIYCKSGDGQVRMDLP